MNKALKAVAKIGRQSAVNTRQTVSFVAWYQPKAPAKLIENSKKK